MGAGPAGMMHVILSKLLGAGKIILIDINNFRLGFAKNYDATIQIINSMTEKDSVQQIRNLTDSRGVDMSIVATGNVRALLHSLDITRKAGKIVIFGVPPKGSKITFDISKLYLNEQSLIPGYCDHQKSKQIKH